MRGICQARSGSSLEGGRNQRKWLRELIGKR